MLNVIIHAAIKQRPLVPAQAHAGGRWAVELPAFAHRRRA